MKPNDDLKKEDDYANGHGIPNTLKRYKNSPPLPVGSELIEFLRNWYPVPLYTAAVNAWRTSNAPAFAALRWAIGGRAQEVLDCLDASSEQIDHDIAYKIREIAATDRRGYIAATAYFLSLYGWLGKELGNRTWIETKNGVWEKYYGEARKALVAAYGPSRQPPLPPKKTTDPADQAWISRLREEARQDMDEKIRSCLEKQRNGVDE